MAVAALQDHTLPVNHHASPGVRRTRDGQVICAREASDGILSEGLLNRDTGNPGSLESESESESEDEGADPAAQHEEDEEEDEEDDEEDTGAAIDEQLRQVKLPAQIWVFL
jgi:hypothetical protein